MAKLIDFFRLGKISTARMPMIAITTRISIKVIPGLHRFRLEVREPVRQVRGPEAGMDEDDGVMIGLN